MNRLFPIVVLGCALAGGGLFAADTNTAGKSHSAATQPATQSATPINKFCAVETENPVDPTVPTVVYDGKVIGFCCEDCIPKFKKDPAYYMKGLK